MTNITDAKEAGDSSFGRIEPITITGHRNKANGLMPKGSVTQYDKTNRVSGKALHQRLLWRSPVAQRLSEPEK